MTTSGLLSFLASHGMGRALRHRNFAYYAIAGWISNIGLWVQRTAVFWLVWELTGSWAALGGIAFAEAVSTMSVMPFAGIIVDRTNRLIYARFSQASLMIIAALFTAMSAFDLINIYVLYVLMVVQGIAEGFWTPVRMAMPPSLVPREDLAPALGVTATFFNLAHIIGPAIGGGLIALLGVTWALGFNAVSFIGYFAVLFMISLRFTGKKEKKQSSIATEFKEGLLYIGHMPGLGYFLLLAISFNVCLRSFRDLFAGISDGVFGMGVEGLAILSSSSGAGAMIAALVMANFGKVSGLVRRIMICLIIAAAVQIIFAVTDIFWVSVACAALMSACATVGGIGGQLVVQTAIHGSVRGRVMSIWGMVLRGGPSSGAWMIGMLAGFTDFQIALLLATAVFIVAWGWFIRKTDFMASSLELSPDEREKIKR